jgi:hypothetical protein
MSWAVPFTRLSSDAKEPTLGRVGVRSKDRKGGPDYLGDGGGDNRDRTFTLEELGHPRGIGQAYCCPIRRRRGLDLGPLYQGTISVMDLSLKTPAIGASSAASCMCPKGQYRSGLPGRYNLCALNLRQTDAPFGVLLGKSQRAGRKLADH